MTAARQWRMTVPRDFGFSPVVHSHGWFQCPPFRWNPAERELERVVRGARGAPLLVRIREPRRGELEIETPARASGPHQRAHVERLVTRMLDLDLPLRGFHRLCARHPMLGHLPRIGAGRMLRNPSVWEDLVKGICGTNVAWPQAVKMTARIAEMGSRLSAGSHAWPTPEEVLGIGKRRLEERARVGYRADAIIELARRVDRGELDLSPAERGELDADELRALFLSVRGIGPATTNYLLLVHGHSHSLSIDSAVYAFTARRYFDGRRPTAREIERLYHPFGEWKARIYLFEFLVDSWWPSIGYRATQRARKPRQLCKINM